MFEFLGALFGLTIVGLNKSAKELERGNAMRGKTKCNATLQDYYETKIFKEVWARQREYERAGYSEREYIELLYKDFGVPMMKDVKDDCVKYLIMRKDSPATVVQLATRKQMRALGYSYVPYYGMSRWQMDTQKKQGEVETHNKYPWLI